MPLRAVPSPTGLPSKRGPSSGSSQERTGESGSFGMWHHPRGSSRMSSCDRPPLEVRRQVREPLPDHAGESPLLSRSVGEKGLRGSGAGTLGVPLEGTRRVGKFWRSHEGCQVPFRNSGRNVRLPLRRRSGQGPHLAKTLGPRGFSRVAAVFSSYSGGLRPLVELCVEPAGLCGRCTGVAVPLRVVPSPTGLPSKRGPGLGSFSRADRGIGGVRPVAPPTWLGSNFLVRPASS